MKVHTQEEVERFVLDTWDLALEAIDEPTVEITPQGSGWDIEISKMYSYVPLNLELLLKLSEFMGTKNINDTRWSERGCVTCDYGSSYTVTLTVREEE